MYIYIIWIAPTAVNEKMNLLKYSTYIILKLLSTYEGIQLNIIHNRTL